MTFAEFTKEAAEKEAAYKAAQEELKKTGMALQAFYRDVLGVDMNGAITVEQVSQLVGKVVDMKGANA